MKIVSFLPSSFIDYPGKISAVVFTPGCNFKCGFCHNKEIVENKLSLIPEDEILKKIKTKWVDAVVITGGEPTLQEDLEKFIKKVKAKHLLVKLDTNGSNPDIIQNIIDKKLVDYIAMDIKCSIEKYGEVSKYNNTKNILKSIKIIKNSKVNHMFRTTLIPSIHNKKEILNIVNLIKGSKNYQLQSFNSNSTLDESFQGQSSYSKQEMDNFKGLIKNKIKNITVI
ncbi:MAG: anaerobic ribonucleoside-triphosphate reductase activating protein [Candidatus Nanoarchaeia archaeon]|nr:anaerobic ribonucleoside-triphosphate reductase activating protein [Candidatus Nanoarchaeia archaeon]